MDRGLITRNLEMILDGISIIALITLIVLMVIIGFGAILLILPLIVGGILIDYMITTERGNRNE